jgi:transposase InsO family protein
MDEKAERRLRRKALRWLCLGKRPSEVLKRIGRSRTWLSKWRTRFGEQGIAGLRGQSRKPRTSPQAWASEMTGLIVQTRKRLSQAPAGVIGARAIRHELKQLMPRRALPSATTIYRVLHQAGVLTPQPLSAAPYFPAPSEEVDGSLDALDWTCRYLEGGTKVYAFHTLNLRTRALYQTLADNKELRTAHAHVLAAWEIRGLPRFLQLDNDAIFCGGYKVARVFGQFTRLCLYVGVELIFLPFGEPKHNSQVERLNGLWGGPAFWERHRFGGLGQVRRLSAQFVEWYMHDYRPPALNGATPTQRQRTEHRPRLTRTLRRGLPAVLPITAGRVHFIRLVQPDGTIRLLNELWRVPKALAGHYVWATITTHHHTLDIWFRRELNQDWRLVTHAQYHLAEPVLKRPPSFASLFTMS